MDVFKKGLAASVAGEKPDPRSRSTARTSRRSRRSGPWPPRPRRRRARPSCDRGEGAGRRRRPPRASSHDDQARHRRAAQADRPVKVNYRGTLIDGTEFDSSTSAASRPSSRLNGVIKCWTEGSADEGRRQASWSARPTSPTATAAAARDSARATLVFEVELLGIGAEPRAARRAGRPVRALGRAPEARPGVLR